MDRNGSGWIFGLCYRGVLADSAVCAVNKRRLVDAHDRWFVGSLALTGPLGMLIAIVMQIANKVPHRDPNIRAEW